MTYPRKHLIADDTPYYHCVARCVRRAWLWGEDAVTGKDYSHRKGWVIDRLRLLSDVFAIDICAYAVMSNHYHVVLRVNREQAAGWSVTDIVRRWSQLFGLPPMVERYRSGQVTCQVEEERVLEIINLWRQRLSDISWFMRCLNEHLARLANAEDGCRGRFWEGRFKSQALLDDAGLLTAMLYVDLNPLRAGIAETPETSVFTSVYARLQQRASVRSADPPVPQPGQGDSGYVTLLPFRRHRDDDVIPFYLSDYLELLDWTGRAVRHDKRGHLPADLPGILTRLNIDPLAWKQTMLPQGNRFGCAIGQVDRLRAYALRLGQSWVRGLGASQRLYRVTQ
jgi:REP element-mobilizing transposase RayT